MNMRGFINADIWKNTATAFIVDEGRFAFLGTDEEVKQRLTESDELIDLQGMFVTPGFIDSHMHLLGYGHFLNGLQLAGAHSVMDVMRMLKKKADEHPDWIIARGFNEELFDVPAMPLKSDLDAVSTEIPISITRVCGHKMIANSKALELAGIGPDSVIEGGYIDFEKGYLEESGMNPVQAVWPKPTVESMQKDILAGSKSLNSYGITSCGSDDFVSLSNDWRMVIDAYMRLGYQRRMTVRVNEQCHFENPREFAHFLDEGYTFDVGDDYFRIGPLKIIADGSLGARTAALTKPYSDAPEKKGILIYTKSEMKIFLELASRYNMPSIIHAIGDRALDQVLKLYDDVVLEGNPLHHGIVHCQIMTPEQIRKVVDMKLNCYFQSLFVDFDAKILNSRVGEKRAASSYPYRTLFEGTCASNGSDAPVEVPDPLKGIQLAVTRTSLDKSASMNPDECLTVDQAIESYTEKAAQTFFADDRLGKICEGYIADFAVTDRNITKIPADEISACRIMMTVMDGETVFER